MDNLEMRLEALERRVRRLEGEQPISPLQIRRENIEVLTDLAEAGERVRYGHSVNVRACLQRLIAYGLAETDSEPPERVRITESGRAWLQRVEDRHARVREAYEGKPTLGGSGGGV